MRYTFLGRLSLAPMLAMLVGCSGSGGQPVAPIVTGAAPTASPTPIATATPAPTATPTPPPTATPTPTPTPTATPTSVPDIAIAPNPLNFVSSASSPAPVTVSQTGNDGNFTATTGNAAVATVDASTSNGSLTITPHGAGTTTITVLGNGGATTAETVNVEGVPVVVSVKHRAGNTP